MINFLLPSDTAPAFSFRANRNAQFGLLIVFALALLMRLGWPGLVDYKMDEGTLGQKALDIARGRAFPLDGIWSSRGVPTPPNMAYLLAVPFLFSDSPVIETAWVSLLSLAGLAVCYWLAYRYFGLLAAVLGLGLYAVSPWAVYFARRAMPMSLLFLPVALVVLTGLLGFVEARPRWQALHLVALAFAIETHLSAVSLALLTGYLLLIFRRHLNWRWLAGGALVAAATTLPVWIVVARQYEAIRADLAEPAERTSETLISPQALQMALTNTVGAQFYTLTEPEARPGEPPRDDRVLPFLWAEGFWLTAGLAALAGYAGRSRRNRAGKAAGVLVAWTLAPVIAFTAQWTAVYHHYFVPLMPAPYLAVGAATALGIGWLRARFRPAAAIGVGLAALAIMGAQIYMYAGVMRYFAAHFTPGDLGTPLELKMEAGRMAREFVAETGAAEIVIVGEGDRAWGYETAAVFGVILDSTPHRFATGTESVVFPAGGAVIMTVPGEWPAAAWYQAHAESRGELPLRLGELPYRFFYSAGGVALDGFTAPESPATIGNGATVIGYRWEAPLSAGDPGLLTFAWRVDAASPQPADYHFVVYLQDAAGQVWAQNDGRAFPSDMWRTGDVVVNWITLPPPAELPDGPMSLRLGMYTYPDIIRAPVVGPDGAPLSDAVQLATFTLQP